MSRVFSKEQREAVALISDANESELHADHIIPHAKGGETTVENCQLLSPEINNKKSDTILPLRSWQSDFIEVWNSRDAGRPFLLVAIPGGGKTVSALTAARNWMAAGSDRRVIVVVPTSNLKDQWKTEAADFGIQLQTDEFGTNFKHGFQGCAVTYAGVASSPLVFRKLCAVSPVLVIFDEIHHCGDNATYGRGVKDAFTLAKEFLLLSGTPWKTNGDPIPFVRYDGDGFCVTDFRYDYPSAIQDEVVRWLTFHFGMGSITAESSGHTDEFNLGITEDEASRLLRKFLNPTGEYVRETIRKAHAKLMECRKTLPNAGAMAACIDKHHADKVARVITEETGCVPLIVVSDSEIGTGTVKEYRSGRTEWLVSVRQVSEGTDIKRLQVLCYLTNWVTELFFRQLIGRVSRKITDAEDHEAHVYLPSDPRLDAFRKNIENAQVQAISETQTPEPQERKEREQKELFDDFYSTEHGGIEKTTIAGREYEPAVARYIERMAESIGVSMEKAARSYEYFLANGIIQPQVAVRSEVPLEDKLHALRVECNKRAFRLSKIMDCDVSEIHSKFAPQRDMTEVNLNAKLKTIALWMKEASSR